MAFVLVVADDDEDREAIRVVDDSHDRLKNRPLFDNGSCVRQPASRDLSALLARRNHDQGRAKKKAYYC